MASRVISAVLKFKDQNFSSGLRQANRQAGDFGRAVNTAQNKVEGMAKSVKNGFKTIGTAAAALGAGAVAGLAAAVGQSVLEMEEAFGKLQAQTGATGDSLTVLKDAAKETFAKGYGESLTEVSEAVARVKQNMHAIDGSEIANVTSKALNLATTFDSDVNEVTRGTNNLMQAFGTSAETAFDLFTTGGQLGLNFSNEMFDNVAEYAPLFGKMGYSAEEYFGILERGAQKGVFNLDYVNDVMKEFQIRVKDGSKSTDEAMSVMSKSTFDLWEAMNRGEATVADVAGAVAKELSGMDDQVTASQLAVSLFGTKFEDLESEAVYAMLGSTDAMKDFEGSAQAAADAVEQSFGNRVKSAFRDATLSIASLADSEAGKEMLDSLATSAENLVPKVVSVSEKAIELANNFKEHWPQIRETVIGITTAVVAFKVGMMAMSIVSTVTGFIKAFRAAVVAGTASQWALNVALSANPIGLVIGVVAALAAGIVLLYRNSDKFRDGWNNAWNSIKSAAGNGVNFVVEKLNDLINIMNKVPGVNIPIIPKVQWGNANVAGDKKVYTAASKAAEMASFDVGTDRVTHDQVAQIHKDEMIIPARQAQRVRAQGGNIGNIDTLASSKQAPSTTASQSVEGKSSGNTFTFGNIVIQGAENAEQVVKDFMRLVKFELAKI
ncbi:MAG: phage tail tape measure protein [Solibacillus sp.]